MVALQLTVSEIFFKSRSHFKTKGKSVFLHLLDKHP